MSWDSASTQASPPDLAAVVVTFNSADTIRPCLEALRRATAGLSAETVVVDNASSDGTAAIVVAEFPDVRFVASPDNGGFAAGCNQGIRATGARNIVLVNPDAEVEPGTLQAMVAFLDKETGAGLAGCAHVDEAGRFYLSCHPPLSVATVAWTHFQVGRLLPGRVHARFLQAARDPAGNPFQVGWAMGSCLMVKRAVLDAVGLLDESFFLYAEEADLCERARKAGWSVWFLPGARVRHTGGHSSDQVPFVRLSNYYVSKLRYFAKHGAGAALGAVRALFVVDLLARCAIRALQAVAGNPRARDRMGMYARILALVLAYRR